MRVVEEEVVVGVEEEAEALDKQEKNSCLIMCDVNRLVLLLPVYYRQPALVCRHQTRRVKGRWRRANAPLLRAHSHTKPFQSAVFP